MKTDIAPLFLEKLISATEEDRDVIEQILADSDSSECSKQDEVHIKNNRKQLEKKQR